MPLKKQFTYIAFFDLDETVLSVNSANYLVKESRRRGMMTKRQFRQAVRYSLMYKFRLSKATSIIYKMLAWLRGLSRVELDKMCQEVYDSLLFDFIRPEIIDEIKIHRQNNAAIVLLSSATTFACFPVVSYLKMDDVICSHMEDVDGILTGKPLHSLVFGEEKKHRLLEYCEKEGYHPQDAYYYGDAFSDLHVLEAVGHPVCVSPEKPLYKAAIKHGWRIL